MNKSIVLASLILANASLMATETKWFVGLDMSKVKSSVKEKVSGTVAVTYNGAAYLNASGTLEDTTNVDDSAPGIKVGMILNDVNRISLHYTKYDFDYNSELTKYMLSYDYLFSPISGFSPYLGAHLAQAKLNAYDGFAKDSGQIYGVQAGILYGITSNLEFEAGIALSQTNINPTLGLSATYTSGPWTATGTGQYTMDINNMTTMFAGFNYKF